MGLAGFWSKRLAGASILGACAALGLATTAGAETTLSVVTVDYQNDAVSYLQNAVIPAFEKAHPGVHVNLQVLTWSNYTEKYTTWFAAGTMPDVFQSGSASLGGYLASHMVQPIDAFVKGWPDLKDFPKAVLADGTYAGHLYDIPFRLDQRALLYRTDLFAKYGLDPKRPPATWDELVDDGKKLTVRGAGGKVEQMGYRLEVSGTAGAQSFSSLLFEAGGNLFTPDFRKARFGDDASITALQFASDLVNKYGISTPDGKGDWAMFMRNSWYITNYELKDQIGVGVPPMGPAARSGSVFINKWYISSQSKQADLAWAWIAYLSSPEVMAHISATAGHMPPRLSMLNREPWSADPRWRSFYEAAGVTQPFQAQIPTFSKALYTHVYKAFRDTIANKSSAANAARAAGQTIQAELDEYWRSQDAGAQK